LRIERALTAMWNATRVDCAAVTGSYGQVLLYAGGRTLGLRDILGAGAALLMRRRSGSRRPFCPASTEWPIVTEEWGTRSSSSESFISRAANANQGPAGSAKPSGAADSTGTATVMPARHSLQDGVPSVAAANGTKRRWRLFNARQPHSA
jgi:hypothetical protein